MEEMLYKFIDEGRREHEEMGAFIIEFKTTNELLLKERNNSLSKLEFEVYGLSKAINNAQLSNYEVKGVTTRGGKTTTEILSDTNDINKEPMILHHDKLIEPKEVLVKTKPLETKEQTIQPLTPLIPFPHSFPTAKGEELRVADSHTGNYPKDGFTPLETIRSSLLLEIFFSKSKYFKVHISRLNPFGCAKVTTFIIMCKAYGCEPSIDLFREMDFRNFINTEDDDDLAFLPKEPSSGFDIGSPSASVNTELPKVVEEPEVQPAENTADSGESPKAGVFIIHPRSVAARIKERKCKTRGGSSM
ncbi:hypothetical protein Tco_0191203 [Tanacetum coccineum]